VITPLVRDLSISVGAVVVACVVFYRVSREEITAERTATDELRERGLDFYKQHINESAGLGVMTETRERSSRSGLRPVRQENVTRAAKD
jgi:hypothetical protein